MLLRKPARAMSELSDLDGPELYLALCRKRITEWEQASGPRREFEAAEAFTRAFAELDAALKAGAELPASWHPAIPDSAPAPGPDGIYPVVEMFGAHSARISKEDGSVELLDSQPGPWVTVMHADLEVLLDRVQHQITLTPGERAAVERLSAAIANVRSK